MSSSVTYRAFDAAFLGTSLRGRFRLGAPAERPHGPPAGDDLRHRRRGPARAHDHAGRTPPNAVVQFFVGWISRSVVNAPLNTRTTSCPLVSVASTPAPNPAGVSTVRSYPPYSHSWMA